MVGDSETAASWRQLLPVSGTMATLNPVPPAGAHFFLKFFLKKGCGLEIASAGELHLALATGCPPSDIVFAGPGKTEAELELAITQGIGEISLKCLTLQMNFRSQANLVHWVNKMFSELMPLNENLRSGAVPFNKSIPVLRSERYIYHG